MLRINSGLINLIKQVGLDRIDKMPDGLLRDLIEEAKDLKDEDVALMMTDPKLDIRERGKELRKLREILEEMK